MKKIKYIITKYWEFADLIWDEYLVEFQSFEQLCLIEICIELLIRLWLK